MIERVVHRIWLGGPEPEWQQHFAASWQQPGWELRQWDEAAVEELFPLTNQRIYDRAEQIAPNHVGQLRSDVLRYEILLRHGGVYVDADFECLRPIDPLIDGAECFAAWEIQGRWIANGLVGAVPAHPFIEALVRQLPRSVAANRGSKPNKMTGPQFFTRVARTYRREITVLDQHLVYPFGWREIDDFEPGAIDPAERWPDAYAIHWWANKRRERALV